MKITAVCPYFSEAQKAETKIHVDENKNKRAEKCKKSVIEKCNIFIKSGYARAEIITDTMKLWVMPIIMLLVTPPSSTIR
jgi:hypothetical protein